jgi:plasminogen activator inhibitor 1 RNA-binding protein
MRLTLDVDNDPEDPVKQPPPSKTAAKVGDKKPVAAAVKPAPVTRDEGSHRGGRGGRGRGGVSGNEAAYRDRGAGSYHNRERTTEEGGMWFSVIKGPTNCM